MDQIIPMTALHARRIRILKESEDRLRLAEHVESRDNAAILDFLKNVEDINDRASLFQSAVLKLTCNNDAETLGAVLDYGKDFKELNVQWTEIEIDKDKKKSKDFEWLKKELSGEEGQGKGKERARNPIIVASEQASFSSYTFYTFMFIIANYFVGLPSVHKKALQFWLPDSPSSIYTIRHCFSRARPTASAKARARASGRRTRKISVRSGDREPREG